MAPALQTQRQTERAQELARAILVAHHGIGRIIVGRLHERGTLSTARVFYQLAAGPKRAGELAQACLLTPSAMTELVDPLVRDGLLRREDDPTDRRAVVLALTPRGRREMERSKALAAEALAAVVAHLSPEKLARLHAAFTDLDEALAASAQATKESPHVR